jgi:hypothetical protein
MKLPHQDDVQNPYSNLASSMSRSPVVFEDLNHVFRVRFIASEPWNEYRTTLVKCSNLAGARSRSPGVFEDLNTVFCPSVCANFV